MRKTAFVLALTLVLLVSAVAGAQQSLFAKANFVPSSKSYDYHNLSDQQQHL